MLGLFLLLMLTAVFFRAESVGQAFEYISNIFSFSFLVRPDFEQIVFILPIIIFFLLMEWINKDKQHALQYKNQPLYLAWSAYLIIGFMIVLSVNSNTSSFIYLQF